MTAQRPVPRRGRRLFAALAVVAIAGGCSGPILANAPVARPSPPAASPAPSSPRDPVPIVLPRDDGPHHRLTEWWYDTGHLQDASGRQWGFEYVIFRAERGGFPVIWASHLALTDERGNAFTFAQRSEIGPQVDRATSSTSGFDLSIAGGAAIPGAGGSGASASPRASGAPQPTPWTMVGGGGSDQLVAAADASEASGHPRSFGIDLRLRTSRPPALHDGDGWIDFGPGGSSYYYSRTRMAVTGTLSVDGTPMGVDGTAWFDHQWGDFIAVGGGWDWFAVNLDDGTDLTLSLVRDGEGGYPLVYGTLVHPDGSTEHLDRDAFTVAVTRHWTSPTTKATYPAGWQVRIPEHALVIDLSPTVADQELDTRPTTGVVYWEGSQVVSASRSGRSVGGKAYVELTGYGAGP